MATLSCSPKLEYSGFKIPPDLPPWVSNHFGDYRLLAIAPLRSRLCKYVKRPESKTERFMALNGYLPKRLSTLFFSQWLLYNIQAADGGPAQPRSRRREGDRHQDQNSHRSLGRRTWQTVGVYQGPIGS